MEQPTNRDPGFVATFTGTYLVRSTVTAANGPRSVDTVTVIVRADAPPIGWRIDTVADARGTIMLNGTAVPDTDRELRSRRRRGDRLYQRASYAVFNRQTLALVTSGNLVNNAVSDPVTKTLLELATRYNASPTYLMVVNLQGLVVQRRTGASCLRCWASRGSLAPTCSERFTVTLSRSWVFRGRPRARLSSQTSFRSCSTDRSCRRTCRAICV